MPDQINGATADGTLARLLWEAQRTATPLSYPSAPDLDVAAGHAVQAAGLALRTAAGDPSGGRKVGLTSRAAQQAMSAPEPVSGYLPASTIGAVATEYDCAGLVAPRVEVEIAFVLARDLDGPDVTAAQVVAATAHLALAFEVVDSRWAGGPPGVGALLADDVSAAAVIVGPEADPATDLTGLRVTARVGDVRVDGDAGNVMGDPARAVAWLCADLHRRGDGLRAGDLVLSGALCGPTPVRPGDAVEADFGDLGSLATVFVAR
jgi:2-keto-4-pentenoate hydratase